MKRGCFIPIFHWLCFLWPLVWSIHFHSSDRMMYRRQLPKECQIRMERITERMYEYSMSFNSSSTLSTQFLCSPWNVLFRFYTYTPKLTSKGFYRYSSMCDSHVNCTLCRSPNNYPYKSIGDSIQGSPIMPGAWTIWRIQHNLFFHFCFGSLKRMITWRIIRSQERFQVNPFVGIKEVMNNGIAIVYCRIIFPI